MGRSKIPGSFIQYNPDPGGLCDVVVGVLSVTLVVQRGGGGGGVGRYTGRRG